MKAKIIDIANVRAEYDMPKILAIVEHSKHGRIYIAQGFGGMDTLAGGAVRWRHGIACALQPNDTIKSLQGTSWNACTSVFTAMVCGYDASRPVLNLSGQAIKLIAESAGLSGV